MTSPEVVRRTLPLRVTGELPPPAGRAVLARLRPLHRTMWHSVRHNLSEQRIDRKGGLCVHTLVLCAERGFLLHQKQVVRLPREPCAPMASSHTWDLTLRKPCRLEACLA